MTLVMELTRAGERVSTFVHLHTPRWTSKISYISRSKHCLSTLSTFFIKKDIHEYTVGHSKLSEKGGQGGQILETLEE
jgi:hypothetical protein